MATKLKAKDPIRRGGLGVDHVKFALQTMVSVAGATDFIPGLKMAAQLALSIVDVTRVWHFFSSLFVSDVDNIFDADSQEQQTGLCCSR